ncbi:MAG: MBL fold metallo-hydrolase [Gammaproteobacteria bacterium]
MSSNSHPIGSKRPDSASVDNAGRTHNLARTLGIVCLLVLVLAAGLMHGLRQSSPGSGSDSRASQTPAEKSLEAISQTAVLVSDVDTSVVAAPYLFVLGVAQDAGYPQAGCYQPHCLTGWEVPGAKRGATALGLVTSAQKYLFEATPDFPSQLYAFEQEAPSETHPLAGIFLTHAHIGHYSGLMYLGHEVMGASEMPVFAMPRMSEFLKENGPWSQLVGFENIVLKSLQHERSVDAGGGVRVTPFLVPHRDEFSETVGYRIASESRSAVFIPDINKWQVWSEDLREVVKANDYALIDATFFADGELPGRDMSKIPHPFVSESMALLQDLPADERNKVWFIHLNHTNPLLVKDSEEARLVEAAGYHVAREGIRLAL